MNPITARCAGAAVGLLIDRLLGEPPARLHPVLYSAELWNMPSPHYGMTGAALEFSMP